MGQTESQTATVVTRSNDTRTGLENGETSSIVENKSKNVNHGPPILERAKRFMKEREYDGKVYEEEGYLVEGYHIPHIPEGMIGLVIPSVLSKEECEGIINVIPSEGQGYLSPEDIQRLYINRIVHRYQTCDPAMSSLIFERIRRFLPETLDGGQFVAISPGWRFLRYEAGGHQAPHLDGRETSLIDHPNYSLVQSRLTIQMYLNDHQQNNPQGYQGGEMVFYANDGETIRHIHYPRAGDCLLFFQESLKNDDFELIHEAKPVQEGTKYAMRTVVEYGWV
jgi:hypothetical protein